MEARRIITLLTLTSLMLVSCGPNNPQENGDAAFYKGGSIYVAKGERVICVTEKRGEIISYLTEPMDSAYTPKTKKYYSKDGRCRKVFIERR